MPGAGGQASPTGNLAEPLLASTAGLGLIDHRLYVVDAEDSAIRRIDLRPGSEKVETLVGTGLFDFGDHNGAFANAKLQYAPGVAARDENRILIADTHNHKIKILDLKSRTVSLHWPERANREKMPI